MTQTQNVTLRERFRWLVPAVFFLALCVRCYHLNTPFLEPFNSLSRQSICAQVVRNFYERSSYLFYPQVDINGDGPALYNGELPFYSWLMAAGYRIVGGAEEWVARSVTVLFSMFFLWWLYRIVCDHMDPDAALGTLVAAGFSPLSVALSRSIQPDMTMLACMTGAVYWALRYAKGGGLADLLLSGVLLFFAAATKLFAYLAVPAIFAILWGRSGADIFRSPRYYGYVLIAGAALIWYGWMWYLGRTVSLGYQPLQYYHGEESSLRTYLSFWAPQKVAVVLKVLALHQLTLAGVAAVFAAVMAVRKKGLPRFYIFWGVGTLGYTLAVWPYLVKHGYYQLPWLPLLSILAGIGIRHLRSRLLQMTLAAILAAHCVYYYPKIYFITEKAEQVIRIGAIADKLLPKDVLVIASYGSSPVMVYYTHRRGWPLTLQGEEERRVIERVESYRSRGARYWVTSEPEVLSSIPIFSAYLAEHATQVHSDASGMIYRFVS